MKRTLVFVVLLLSLFAYKVNAAPNTGTLPENGVKVNFNANGTYSSVEGDEWMVDEHHDGLMLSKDGVVIHLMHYVFNDEGEIIGFHWMVEGATAILWVKHGTTQEEYGNGTSGVFVTSNSKALSNAVFLIEFDHDHDDEMEDDHEHHDDHEHEHEVEVVDKKKK